MDAEAFPRADEPGRRVLGLLAARIIEDGGPAGFEGEIALGVDGEPALWLVIEAHVGAPCGVHFDEGATVADNRVHGPPEAWEAAFTGKPTSASLEGRGDQEVFARLIKRYTETKNWLAIRAGS